MRKLILIAHISLDGFVAGAKGELEGFEAGEENLQFVCDLTGNADAALFGRVSYQLLHHYWPTAKDSKGATAGEIAYSRWYNQAKKIVISRTLSARDHPGIQIISDNIPDEIQKLKLGPGKDILIFGSPSVSQLLISLNLVDEYWIFINPVLFGSGIPLFSGNASMRLKVLDIMKFSNGEIAIHYSF